MPPPRAAPRRRSRRARLRLAVGLPPAALVVGLLLGLLLGLVVTRPAPAPAPPVSPAVAFAPAPAAAFPDVAAPGASCTPFDPGARGYTTSTGARAVAVADRGSTGGVVYATAADADRPYGCDVVTRSAQDTPLVFGAMHLRPAAAIPG